MIPFCTSKSLMWTETVSILTVVKRRVLLSKTRIKYQDMESLKIEKWLSAGQQCLIYLLFPGFWFSPGIQLPVTIQRCLLGACWTGQGLWSKRSWEPLVPASCSIPYKQTKEDPFRLALFVSFQPSFHLNQLDFFYFMQPNYFMQELNTKTGSCQKVRH